MTNTQTARPGPGELSVALGGRIRAARNERQLSLRSLAERIGVSPATMSAIENGRTSVSAVRLAGIAAELGVGFESLLVQPADQPDPAAPATEAERDWRRYDAEPFAPPLQAALEAFLEVGYHGATMRDIAGRAGLSVPGIYHHYASKQDMLVAILDHTMDDLMWRAQAAAAEATDPVSRFSLLVECLVLFHTKRREWGFVGRSELRGVQGAARDRIREKRIEVQRMVTTELEAARAAGRRTVDNPAGAARATVLMCVGVSQWFTDDGPQTAEEIALEYVELALNLVGLAPR